MEEKDKGLSQEELVKEDPAQTDPPTPILVGEGPLGTQDDNNTKK